MVPPPDLFLAAVPQEAMASMATKMCLPTKIDVRIVEADGTRRSWEHGSQAARHGH